jgi:hypothetical protein
MIVGSFVGVVIMALMNVASQADESIGVDQYK